MWNQYESAGERIARTTNTVEGWHRGIQSLLMCSHPTLWLLIEGLDKDCRKQKAACLQGIPGVHDGSVKKYRNLLQKVKRTVHEYGRTEVLTYLREIAHLSHA